MESAFKNSKLSSEKEHVTFYIWKSTKFIQDELSKELRQSFTRLESILVKLIDNSKKAEIKQEGLIESYKSLVEIITRILNK